MTDAHPPRADLILLEPGFDDPAFPGTVYFDRYSALLEGVLRSYPHLEKRISVHRVAMIAPAPATERRTRHRNPDAVGRLVVRRTISVGGALDAHDGLPIGVAHPYQERVQAFGQWRSF